MSLIEPTVPISPKSVLTPKVSVLVPCYNVEAYLNECVDSILNQSFADFEVICLNDGSTDTTLDILREYERLDARVTVVDKSNSGYGATMNIGLDMAVGKYIAIVESDDFIESNMFELLYNEAEECRLDVARSKYFMHIGAKVKVFDEVCDVLYDEVYRPIDNLNVFLQSPSIWCSLYRREFLKESNIRFLETPGASFQDTSFAFKVYATAERFKMIPTPLLHYRINDNSSVKSSAKIFCICDEYEEMYRFTHAVNLYDKLKYTLVRMQYAGYIWNHARIYHRSDKYSFLLRWSRESRANFRRKEVSSRQFSIGKFIRLVILTYLPMVYYFRKKI